MQLGEELPLFGIVAGTVDLAAQGKPLLRPGGQALGRGAVGIDTGVVSFVHVPNIEPGLDVALEDFGQVVVGVKLVFVSNASEGVNGVE